MNGGICLMNGENYFFIFVKKITFARRLFNNKIWNNGNTY